MKSLLELLALALVCVALASPALADCKPGSGSGSGGDVRCLAERVSELERQLENAVVTFERTVCPDGWIAYDPAHPLLPRPTVKGGPVQRQPAPLVLCRRLNKP